MTNVIGINLSSQTRYDVTASQEDSLLLVIKQTSRRGTARGVDISYHTADGQNYS